MTTSSSVGMGGRARSRQCRARSAAFSWARCCMTVQKLRSGSSVGGGCRSGSIGRRRKPMATVGRSAHLASQTGRASYWPEKGKAR